MKLSDMSNTTDFEIRLDPDGRMCSAHDGFVNMPLHASLVITMQPSHRWHNGNVRLFTNAPCTEIPSVENFERARFYVLPSQLLANEDGDWICRLTPTQPGAFSCAVAFSNSEVNSDLGQDHVADMPTFDFVVSSFLHTPKQELVSLQDLRVQTVLTRCLGSLDKWDQALTETKVAGFNSIHFTPVQLLGSSNSAYSISDHLSLGASLFLDNGDTRALPLLPNGYSFIKTVEGRNEENEFSLLSQTITNLWKEHGLFSLVDVVLNHTSTDSGILVQYPDIAYNLSNSPWLKPAFYLDCSILQASHKFLVMHGGKYEMKSPGALKLLLQFWEHDVLPSFRMWEFYVIDVDRELQRLLKHFRDTQDALHDMCCCGDVGAAASAIHNLDHLHVQSNGERFPVSLKVPQVAEVISQMFHFSSSETSACKDYVSIEKLLRNLLNSINIFFYDVYDRDLASAKRAVQGTATYFWLEERKGKALLSMEQPLVPSYFTRVIHVPSEKFEVDFGLNAHNGQELDTFACNGFIWNGDSRIDICLPGDVTQPYIEATTNAVRSSTFVFNDSNESITRKSTACMSLCDLVSKHSLVPASTPYMRRDIVIWGDCVKLRYGLSYQEAPVLWHRMARYVEGMAEIFHGLRLDNAHGQSLHVLQFMIDAARKVRPNLHVNAELFTGSAERDKDYITSLGIGSLVREAMQTSSLTTLLGALCNYSGRAIGSLQPDAMFGHLACLRQFPKQFGVQFEKLRKSHYFSCGNKVIPSMFYDCTHDNEVPAQRGMALNTLPLMAAVCAAACASGSVRGYDAVPKRNVPVVGEFRPYEEGSLTSNGKTFSSYVCTPARSCLNHIKSYLAREGFVETHAYVVDISHSIGLIIRYNPFTGEQIMFLLRTAFESDDGQECVFFDVDGSYSVPLFAARLSLDQNTSLDYNACASCVETMPAKLEYNFCGQIREAVAAAQGCDTLGMVSTMQSEGLSTQIGLDLCQFCPGSILVLAGQAAQCSWGPIQRSLSNPSDLSADTIEAVQRMMLKNISQITPKLNLEQVSYILFTGESEERDISCQAHGCYHIDGVGRLPYAGIAGIQAILRQVFESGDLDHPVCHHFRSGTWYIDYIIQRFSRMEANDMMSQLCDTLGQARDIIGAVPVGAKPRAMGQLLYGLYWGFCMCTLDKLSLPTNQVGPVTKKRYLPEMSVLQMLSISTLIFYRSVPSAPLLDPSLVDSTSDLAGMNTFSSMSAGLEHFSTGIMRSWGRDTFIALRGILLRTARFEEAEAVICSAAAMIRHGLLPNLLDSGRMPRFNSRDAPWWWLQALQDYCLINPTGSTILSRRVVCLFPEDQVKSYSFQTGKGYRWNGPQKVCTIADIAYEILTKHASGIDFLEWNTGSQIDSLMQQEGFHVQIKLCQQTGFIMGGNKYNCGTWMDKMGNSDAWGSLGVPATPRDGAPIELVGLLYSTLQWLCSPFDKDKTWADEFMSDKLLDNEGNVIISMNDWKQLIKENFHKCFLHEEGVSGDHRIYYKDVYGPSEGHTSVQIRPNQLVAMVVAPDLFDPNNVSKAIATVEAELLSDSNQVGIKTLAQSDHHYRGHYDPGDTSTYETAGGFNYHQGPEWVWPFGYYLIAKLRWLLKSSNPHDQFTRFLVAIQPHRKHLLADVSGSLPELTQTGGMLHDIIISSHVQNYLLEIQVPNVKRAAQPKPGLSPHCLMHSTNY